MANEIILAAWNFLVAFFEKFLNEYIFSNLRLIGWVIFLLILAFIIGRIVKIFVVKSLSILGFKRLSRKTWTESLLRVTGYRGSIVELLGDLFKWLVYILFLAFIIQMIGFPGLADFFNQIGWFMPRFIGAIILLVLGFLIADFFGKVFEEAGRAYLKDDLLAALSGGVARYSIGIIIIIMALSLVGIDALSLNIMFFVILTTFVAILIIGLRDIFPNFSAGISVKTLFKIGQHVEVMGHSGVIESFGPVSVCIKSGNIRTYIPNQAFINNPVIRREKK